MKSKLTKELQDRVVSAIAAGNYLETAAAYAGIDEATFYRWIARGEAEDKGPYREFSEAVKKARAGAEARTVLVVQKAMEDNWQAAAWWLERSFPKKWGRKDRVEMEHSGPGGSPVKIGFDLSALSDKELETLERIVDKATPEPDRD